MLKTEIEKKHHRYMVMHVHSSEVWTLLSLYVMHFDSAFVTWPFLLAPVVPGALPMGWFLSPDSNQSSESNWCVWSCKMLPTLPPEKYNVWSIKLWSIWFRREAKHLSCRTKFVPLDTDAVHMQINTRMQISLAFFSPFLRICEGFFLLCKFTGDASSFSLLCS